jgi:hypothetical protein
LDFTEKLKKIPTKLCEASANILVKVATSKVLMVEQWNCYPIKMKKGKTRSVGVQPFQSACSNGGYMADQSPGLLTIGYH